MKNNPRVVIVGGGFAGLTVARGLANADVSVTLIDRTNHHLFQPLLYQVATAGLSPGDIAAPIRSILSSQANTEVLMHEVTGIDLEARVALAGSHSIPYDYLVIATGARGNYFGHPEWAEHAPGLKSIAEATEVRRRILMAFEEAEIEPDEERRQALMTFVLVGAGPTGVEMAGAIAELAHRAMPPDFRHINPRDARIVLVEAGDRILPAFPESLAEQARAELRRMRVEVRTGCKVEKIDAGGVTVPNERISARTVIWTAGVQATPAAEWLKAEADRGGRVVVEPDLSLPGRPEVFIIGDVAHIEQKGRPIPGVAPAAMQAGAYVAGALRRRIEGREVAPFVYLDKGSLAAVGRSYAIISLGPLKLSGFVAWVLWLTIHIFYLIGFRNRILVVTQWTWAYATYERGVRLIINPAPDKPGESTQPQW